MDRHTFGSSGVSVGHAFCHVLCGGLFCRRGSEVLGRGRQVLDWVQLVRRNFGMGGEEGSRCLWGGTRSPGGVTRSMGESTEDLYGYFEDCAARRQSLRNSS